MLKDSFGKVSFIEDVIGYFSNLFSLLLVQNLIMVVIIINSLSNIYSSELKLMR
jgi:hypothetical protein